MSQTADEYEARVRAAQQELQDATQASTLATTRKIQAENALQAVYDSHARPVRSIANAGFLGSPLRPSAAAAAAATVPSAPRRQTSTVQTRGRTNASRELFPIDVAAADATMRYPRANPVSAERIRATDADYLDSAFDDDGDVETESGVYDTVESPSYGVGPNGFRRSSVSTEEVARRRAAGEPLSQSRFLPDWWPRVHRRRY